MSARGGRSKPRLALTLGDPAGIGPELVARVLASRRLRRLARFTVVGSSLVLDAAGRMVRGWRAVARGVEYDEPMPLAGGLPRPGRPGARSGRLSLRWVERAVELCLQGEVEAVVTAPICKSAWRRAGCAFPGHTGLIASMCAQGEPVMMLVGGGLRVALVTIHVPLARVPRLLSRERIVRSACILDRDLRERFGLRAPRIGVLGLNPHAGEDGMLGSEERRVIKPALRSLRRRGVDARGPLPADTACFQARQGEYDAILAMYHDQGLGPFKTVAFDRGINVTLGLPVIRTSPDHGTACDIAGQGRADPGAMFAAVGLAAELARHAVR